MSNVLIAGCGDVGSVLGGLMNAAGHCVWGIRRDVARLPVGIKPLRCDLRVPIAPDTLPAGIDQVVYLPTPGARTESDYRETFCLGLQNLLRALTAGRHRVARLAFVSSTSVYAQSDGAWVDESSPTTPSNFSGQTLLEAERIAQQAPIPSVVLRLAGIYGPARTRLIERVKSRVPCPGKPLHYTNRIHRDDCAAALRHVLMLESVEPLYVGVDDEPVSLCEVMDWIAARLGMPAPDRTEAAGAGEATGKRCSNRRLKQSGFELRFPSFRDGYAGLLPPTPPRPAPA